MYSELNISQADIFVNTYLIKGYDIVKGYF